MSTDPSDSLEVPLPVCDECGEQVQVTCILAEPSSPEGVAAISAILLMAHKRLAHGAKNSDVEIANLSEVDSDALTRGIEAADLERKSEHPAAPGGVPRLPDEIGLDQPAEHASADAAHPGIRTLRRDERRRMVRRGQAPAGQHELDHLAVLGIPADLLV